MADKDTEINNANKPTIFDQAPSDDVEPPIEEPKVDYRIVSFGGVELPDEEEAEENERL